MKPFLKWAGGKMRLVARLQEALPPGRRLIEPFVGSGAVFLNTGYPTYLLNDLNADLIHLYIELRQNREALIGGARAFFEPEFNNASVYYELRSRFNTSTDKFERACIFVYLNKHGFNGLCRYNAQGGFNVPFGRNAMPRFPEVEMRAFSDRSVLAEFDNVDFRDIFARAERGDVVYCDPPYAPLSSTANFTSYGAGAFGPNEQQALAMCAIAAAKRGITTVISYHNTHYTRSLYSDAQGIEYFDVERRISCDAANRSRAAELLAVYEGKQ